MGTKYTELTVRGYSTPPQNSEQSVHESAAEAVLGAVNRIGLYAVRLEAKRVGTRLAEGLFTGLASGLGVSTTQKLELAPSIVVLRGHRGLDRRERHREGNRAVRMAT